MEFENNYMTELADYTHQETPFHEVPSTSNIVTSMSSIHLNSILQLKKEILDINHRSENNIDNINYQQQVALSSSSSNHRQDDMRLKINRRVSFLPNLVQVSFHFLSLSLDIYDFCVQNYCACF